jgi:hypothetical protein
LQADWSSENAFSLDLPVTRGPALSIEAYGADRRGRFAEVDGSSPPDDCGSFYGKIVGFFTLTPQFWHLMYGGTAPQVTQRAKKKPSKT